MTKTLEIPYSLVKNVRGEVALRPMLPLMLGHADQTIQVGGLLDSGADVNVLPYQLGVELGLSWEAETTRVYLSGNLAQHEARGAILTAVIEDFPPVRLAFAWTQAEHVPLILGQINFFMEFDVCFHRTRQVFTVKAARSDSLRAD